MRAIAITFLLSMIPLMADFYPSTAHSTITAVKQNSVTLKRGFPAKGMSAVIMHNYGNDLKTITSYMRYDGGNRGTLVENEPILHKELPAVKPIVGVGDKVIAGYLYKNILLLAPDAKTYAKITNSAKKNWVHPDLYAMFLSQEGDQ